jgi:hypothetical protein
MPSSLGTEATGILSFEQLCKKVLKYTFVHESNVQITFLCTLVQATDHKFVLLALPFNFVQLALSKSVQVALLDVFAQFKYKVCVQKYTLFVFLQLLLSSNSTFLI